MTGFDPTAPDRDTSKDEPAEFPDNVVPPEALTDDEPTPRNDGADGGAEEGQPS